MQAICWLRPEIFFSYRNYLTIFTKDNASHRKAQVLIVNRKLAAFLPQIWGEKCNMRYKSFVRGDGKGEQKKQYSQRSEKPSAAGTAKILITIRHFYHFPTAHHSLNQDRHSS